MARILVVGVLVLDQILDLPEFPSEDSKQRARSYLERPGGNATNIARILMRAGHQVELLATVAHGPAGDRLLGMLSVMGIGTRFCKRKIGTVPVSIVLRSKASGSRTIIHFRDLPECTYEDFRAVPLEEFDWFHFEGRNPLELRKMLRKVDKVRVDQPISVEFERDEEGLQDLVSLPDLLIFSRAWVEAIFPGRSPEEFLRKAISSSNTALVSLTWGSAGAWLVADGSLHHECRLVTEVQDSLAAGDCFAAGLIQGLISGEPPDMALRTAVELVERKLSRDGLDHLALR